MTENTKNFKEILNENYDKKIKAELVMMGFSGGVADHVVFLMKASGKKLSQIYIAR